VFIYGEQLSGARLIGFGLIWLALLIYSLESLIERRREMAYQYAH